jgi:hypothetical protein
MNKVGKHRWTFLTLAWIAATLLCGCGAAASLPTEAPPPTVDLTAVARATSTPYPTATATATTRPTPSPVATPTRPAIPTPTASVDTGPRRNDVLVGYYRQETQTVWGSTRQCDQLVILNRNALVDKYVDWVRGGNNVNSLDDAGHLVAILDLSVLPNAAQDSVRRSTASNPVTVRMRERPEGGSGAPVCYSVFIVTGVE